jgi:hypothetical protein
MTRRVPVVVIGEGTAAETFRRVLADRSDLIAGTTGLLFEPADRLGPEPSVLVNTGTDVAPMVDAVRDGHATVTSELAPLVANPVDFAVLLADRRLGLGAALLPGLPLAATLSRLVEAGDVVERVELTGGPAAQLIDDALAVSALLGVQLRREDVIVEPDERATSWRTVVGAAAPVVRAGGAPESGVRTVTIRSRSTGPDGVRLAGRVGGDDRVAVALMSDLLELAREEDAPWRAHRRLRAGAA